MHGETTLKINTTMQRKITWMRCFELMNKLVLLLLIATMVIGCDDPLIDYDWETTTKVTFINETSEAILPVGGCDCKVPNILPNSELVYVHTQFEAGSSLSDKPNTNNLGIYIPCIFFYSNTQKCKESVEEKTTWENFRQIREFEFGFTYRFTEERKANAEPCSKEEAVVTCPF